MAQQSARRGRKNQVYSSCPEHAFMIWFRSANSHTGPQFHRCIRGRTDGSIRLRANLLQNHLHLAGRPQMSTRPSRAIDLDQCDRIAIGFAYKGKKPTRKDRGVSS
jgi:hypothetical protein